MDLWMRLSQQHPSIHYLLVDPLFSLEALIKYVCWRLRMEPGKAGWVDYSSQPWGRKRFSRASEAQRGLSKCHVSIKVYF